MLKSHYHCLYKVNYHLVLVTKDRKNCLNGKLPDRLEEIVNNLCDKAGIKVLKFTCNPDYVQLLIEAHPNVMPSRFINNLKTVTSRLMRKEFDNELSKHYSENVLWARGYCLLSAGIDEQASLERYISG